MNEYFAIKYEIITIKFLSWQFTKNKEQYPVIITWKANRNYKNPDNFKWSFVNIFSFDQSVEEIVPQMEGHLHQFYKMKEKILRACTLTSIYGR